MSFLDVPGVKAGALDTSIEAKINDTGSATRAALNSTYATALPTTVVARDSGGLVSSVTDNGMAETYTRDSAGRIATITRNSVTKTVSRDTAGRVTGVA